MPSLTKNITPDRSKINAQDATELKYWSRALSASEDEILAAIEKVGNSAATVRKELTNSKLLKPDDFPLNAEGQRITKQDGSHVAEADDPVVAKDIVDRLNADDAQREEDKWSA
jgi:Ni2+-binding GTPase involved in maturation of urease and hydrogenase